MERYQLSVHRQSPSSFADGFYCVKKHRSRGVFSKCGEWIAAFDLKWVCRYAGAALAAFFLAQTSDASRASRIIMRFSLIACIFVKRLPFSLCFRRCLPQWYPNAGVLGPLVDKTGMKMSIKIKRIVKSRALKRDSWYGYLAILWRRQPFPARCVKYP